MVEKIERQGVERQHKKEKQRKKTSKIEWTPKKILVENFYQEQNKSCIGNSYEEEEKYLVAQNSSLSC